MALRIALEIFDFALPQGFCHDSFNRASWELNIYVSGPNLIYLNIIDFSQMSSIRFLKFELNLYFRKALKWDDMNSKST